MINNPTLLFTDILIFPIIKIVKLIGCGDGSVDKGFATQVLEFKLICSIYVNSQA